MTTAISTVLVSLGLMDAASDVGARLKEPADVEQLLIAAGFHAVRVAVDPVTFRYASIEQYWQNARSTGLRRVLDQLDGSQEARVRAALTERLAAQHQGDGLALAAAAVLAVADR